MLCFRLFPEYKKGFLKNNSNYNIWFWINISLYQIFLSTGLVQQGFPKRQKKKKNVSTAVLPPFYSSQSLSLKWVYVLSLNLLCFFIPLWHFSLYLICLKCHYFSHFHFLPKKLSYSLIHSSNMTFVPSEVAYQHKLLPRLSRVPQTIDYHSLWDLQEFP